MDLISYLASLNFGFFISLAHTQINKTIGRANNHTSITVIPRIRKPIALDYSQHNDWHT